MMKKLVAILLISLFLLSLLVSCSTAASAAGPRANVIIVFNSPVTQDDVKYIKGLDGVIKHTYTIIDGIAANLPQAAVDRLRGIAGKPGSDPAAGRIKYVEDDGIVHALGDNVASADQVVPVVQVMPAATLSR